ncbi:MAG TPA: hypothetical protein VLV89_04900 [Candidatus Acidoferrum sp.]|nr:hypothetical protein [Candidatus Acidoferrum sp.]
MNKLAKFISSAALCAALLLLGVSAKSQATPPPPSNFPDAFFVVSSVDRAHNALILLQPTEIAVVYQLTDKTQFADANGKPLKLTDFRAGDTIYASSHANSDGTLTLDHVRKGDMTVAELRRRYLPGLPANAGMTSQTSAPKRTTAAPAPKNPKGISPSSTPPKSNSTKSGGTNSTTPKTGATKPKSGTTPGKPNSGQTSHQ